LEGPSNGTARFRITIHRPIHHKDIIEAHDTTGPKFTGKTLVFQERDRIRRGEETKRRWRNWWRR